MTSRFRVRGRSQAGVSLLEVLVAIVVLSFGMLGMLGLLLNSLKLTVSSNYRTVAAEQAHAIAESLRANTAHPGDYNNPTAAVTANCLGTGGGLAGCSTTAVPSTTLVGMEFDMWQKRLAAALPLGKGVICRDSTTALPTGTTPVWKCDNAATARFSVQICWNEARTAADTSKVWECVRTNL